MLSSISAWFSKHLADIGLDEDRFEELKAFLRQYEELDEPANIAVDLEMDQR